ncbi:MAG TPA: peptidyl-alpha-hydroxyglycine alpha-amidating lyase family protein [Thermomicrobiales bacterium]|nr:peptidyl-alpha-hydroxyglycine alpha-amidating lyase family protein [Thermomicrobiales bacterium]
MTMTSGQGTITVGGGAFTYAPHEGWGGGPNGHELGLVSDVATDSQDRVYIFNRVPEIAVLVFDREGNFVHSWGQDIFTQPHSIWIDAEDRVYLTDTGDHTVRCCTTDGELLRLWGVPGQPGAPGMPFNRPSGAMVGPSGALYVSDGYGQSRVHKFAPSGELLHSWGEPGSGAGQFSLPHSVWVDRDERVFIIDRENHRIQIFDSDGQYLTEWGGFSRPQGIFIDASDIVYVVEARPGIQIMTLARDALGGWTDAGDGPGRFRQFPHSVCVDSRGDIYVGEVTGHKLFQKFVKV